MANFMAHDFDKLVNEYKQIGNKYIRFFESDKKLVLFGASQLGSEISQHLKGNAIAIDLFCDNDKNKCQKHFQDIFVIPFDVLCSIKDEIKIIITSRWYYQIKAQLDAAGFEDILDYGYEPFIKIFGYPHPHHYPAVFSKYKLLRKRTDIVSSNLDKIKEVYELFEDDLSKDTFYNIMKYRMTYDSKYIYNISECVHYYFNNNFLQFSDDEVLIDAGAYIGDSIYDFIKHTDGRFRKIYSFEPSIINYSHLVSNKNMLPYPHKLAFVHAAIGNQNGHVEFFNNPRSAGYSGSRISDYSKGCISNDTVPIVKLDDYNFSEKITFIKMDIEGAEIDALKGSERILKTIMPKLAISVYHKPDDILEVPLLIKRINNNYKIYLRAKYPYYEKETVCYAV